MKKAIFILIAGLVLSSFAGCKQSEFNNSGDITVISREQGSGTRGAFTELFQVEQKNSDGQKVDYTVETADITNSTAVMRTSVSQNSQAIGYISLGSLDDSVKALKIDGVAANLENIKNKSYRVDKSHSKRTGGTGLGLSIVKHGAILHNAVLELESEIGKGTTVRICFDIKIGS